MPWKQFKVHILQILKKKVLRFELQITMVSVAASGNTSKVCDPSLVSYALEQPEMLRSPDYRHKCDV